MAEDAKKEDPGIGVVAVEAAEKKKKEIILSYQLALPQLSRLAPWVLIVEELNEKFRVWVENLDTGSHVVAALRQVRDFKVCPESPMGAGNVQVRPIPVKAQRAWGCLYDGLLCDDYFTEEKEQARGFKNPPVPTEVNGVQISPEPHYFLVSYAPNRTWELVKRSPVMHTEACRMLREIKSNGGFKRMDTAVFVPTKKVMAVRIVLSSEMVEGKS